MGMDHHEFAGLAAALVSMLGYPIYLLDFLGPGTAPLRRRMFRALGLRGGTAPRLASWAIWAAVQGVIFTGARAQGATATNLLPLAYFVGCVTVTAAAARVGTRDVGRLDVVCFALAVVSLGLLVVVDDPVSALVLAIGTDTIAGVPTLVAVWRNPRSESLAGWVCFLTGAGLNFFALSSLDPRTWSIETAGYTIVVVAQQLFVVTRIILAPKHVRDGPAEGSAARVMHRGSTGEAPDK